MIARFFPGVWGGVAAGIADHLWQSTVFALLVALLAFAFRKNHARVRYWLWFAASVKFLVPLSVLVALGAWLHTVAPKPIADANAATYLAMEEVSQPFELAAVPTLPAQPVALTWTERMRARVGGALLPPILAAVWLVGVLIVLGRWGTRWLKIAAVTRVAPTLDEGREAEALARMARVGGLRRRIELKVLPISVEPGIFGLVRPVLLWPLAISERLDDAQLESIIAHEVCHVRRRDNLTAALHMAVEAVFWFHPLVWWLEARLVEERETACDQEVLALCGQSRAYAESILKVCEFCVESPLACVPGVTGADLKRRIAGIVTARALLRMTWPKKLLLAAAVVCIAAVPVVLGQAESARRLMLAAMKVTPKPVQVAAKAMIAEEDTPATGEIAEAQMPAELPAQTPAASDTHAVGDISGTWQGMASLGQMSLRWVLKVAKKADGSWSATFYNIDQNATPLGATNVSFSGGKFTYTLPQMGSTYEGKLSADGNTLDGEIAMGTRTVPLTYVRATKETAWAIPDPPAPRKAMAADADPDFEVATIKPNNSGGGAMQGVGIQGRDFSMRNSSLGDMIAFAYGVQKNQILNAPGWLSSDRYDITATSEPEGQPSPTQLKTMMRKLLADRFKLTVHTDKREMSAFVLSVDKGGNKLSASQSKAMGPSIRIQPAKNGMSLMVANATLDEFAGFLQTPVLDRPVVNHTGIEGRYDITVTFTPDSSEFGGHVPPPPADGAEAAPDLFQAVQQQLGLKLSSEKTTVDMIAIDHTEKPTEN